MSELRSKGAKERVEWEGENEEEIRRRGGDWAKLIPHSLTQWEK